MSLHSDRAHPPDHTDGPDPTDAAATDDSSTSEENLDRPSGRSLGARVHAASLEAQVDLLSNERERLEREVDRLGRTVTHLETEVDRLERDLDRKDVVLNGIRRRYEGIVAQKERANRQLREDASPSRSRLRTLASLLVGLVPWR